MSDGSVSLPIFANVIFDAAALDSAAAVRGGNQRSLRLSNERLALSLARNSGPMTKIQLARLTGLTIQAATTILNRLEADGLMERGQPIRGRVGQPTVPYCLAASGAYSLGLKVGSVSAELSLIDFLGVVQDTSTLCYSRLDPSALAEFLTRGASLAIRSLPARRRSRVRRRGCLLAKRPWGVSRRFLACRVGRGSFHRNIHADPDVHRRFRDLRLCSGALFWKSSQIASFCLLLCQRRRPRSRRAQRLHPSWPIEPLQRRRRREQRFDLWRVAHSS